MITSKCSALAISPGSVSAMSTRRAAKPDFAAVFLAASATPSALPESVPYSTVSGIFLRGSAAGAAGSAAGLVSAAW
jgi:hypothetical protein